jgi:large subunit ribosomal protein L29
MKPAEMRSMTLDQLSKLETDLQVEWRNMRFQESVGQLTNNARIRTIRKDLARILTIRHERVLDAEIGN